MTSFYEAQLILGTRNIRKQDAATLHGKAALWDTSVQLDKVLQKGTSNHKHKDVAETVCVRDTEYRMEIEVPLTTANLTVCVCLLALLLARLLV